MQARNKFAIFVFLPRHRHHRPRPGLRQTFPSFPWDLAVEGTFLCSALAKINTGDVGGEKEKKSILKQPASEKRGEGGEKGSCVSLITKLFPGGAVAANTSF